MEAANVGLVPAFALFLVLVSGGAVTPSLFLSMVACSALLVVGALYWRAVVRRMDGDRGAMPWALQFIDAAEPACVVLTIGAVGATGVALFEQGFDAAGIGSLILSVLAVLEYVNYYKIQLQHFDHAPDMARFMKGQGFRKAHMARELAAWRRRDRQA